MPTLGGVMTVQGLHHRKPRQTSADPGQQLHHAPGAAVPSVNAGVAAHALIPRSCWPSYSMAKSWISTPTYSQG